MAAWALLSLLVSVWGILVRPTEIIARLWGFEVATFPFPVAMIMLCAFSLVVMLTMKFVRSV